MSYPNSYPIMTNLADDYARPPTIKGNPRNRYPFNILKVKPPPPPPSLFEPAPVGETPNE